MCRKKNFVYHRIHTGSELVNCEEMKKKKVGLQNEKINKFVNRERERDEGKRSTHREVVCTMRARKKTLTAFDRIQIYGFDSQTLSRKMKMIKSIFFYPPAFNKICEQQQRKWQQNLSSSPWQKQKKEDFSGHTSVLHEWKKAEKIASLVLRNEISEGHLY